MRGGLATSVLLHTALLGWALFTIQTQREMRVPEPEPIAVDLVTPGELTKLRQGVRTAKQLEAEAKPTPKTEVAKKEAPKATPPAAAPPPPEPPPPPPAPKEEPPRESKSEPVADKQAAVPPPPQPDPLPPTPSPDAQKQLDEMLQKQQREAEERQKREEEQRRKAEEERRQAELKRKQEEHKRKEAELKRKKEEERKRKEAEAKKKQFDANKIAALLNKTPDKAPPPSAQEPPEQPTRNKGPVLGAPEGRDKQLSASELAVLKQIIRSCIGPKWIIMGGGEEAQNTVVRVRVQFNPDGRLAAPPQVMNPQNTAFFLAASESAVRAVQACEPYPLPASKYEAWRDTVLTLSPRDMF